MKIPMKAVYDILMDSKEITDIVSPDRIFMLDVPEEYQKLEQLPVIRVVEISDRQHRFSSNKPNSLKFSVQVDVWSGNIALLEELSGKIDSLMSEHGWVQYLGNVTTDPDIDNTPRLIRRFRSIQQINFN